MAFLAALVFATLSFWVPEARFGATCVALIAVQAFSAYLFLGRIADLQAALDMKKMHAKSGAVFHLQPDDEIVVHALCTVRALSVCKLEVVD